MGEVSEIAIYNNDTAGAAFCDMRNIEAEEL
jgi:hypothetical protein